MNNGIPYIYSYNYFPLVNNDVQNDFQRFITKLDKIEKNLHLIENQLNKLESTYKVNEYTTNDNSTDMYII